MEQRLIVEGNDSIVLTNIFIKRKMAPPKGYSNPEKYKTEFVKNAGGISKIKTALIEELQSPDVTNIGIIVDANTVGAASRFVTLKNIIEETLNITFPEEAILSNDGFGFQLLDNLFVGIWIMPDNQSNGYLEHFVGGLVPVENRVWQFANEKVEELMATDFCEFSEIKKEKAILHTYLSWKESPGLPMGTAVTANYFDVSHSLADRLSRWFENTFILES